MPQYLTPTEARQDSNAGWAQTFKGGSTNLSQRRRYAEDIAQGSINEDKREAADFDTSMAQNKGLRDLVFGRANQQMAQQKQQLAEERLNFDRSKRDFDEELRLRAEKLKMSEEQRRMNKDARDLANAERISKHTDALENDIQVLMDGGQMEGSPGFAAGAIASILRNPWADKQAKADILKAARIDADPDVLEHQAREMGLEPSGARWDAQSQKLVPTFTKKKEAAPKADDTSKTIDRLKVKVASLDPEEKAAEIARTNKLIRELQARKPAEPAAAPSALPPPPSGFNLIGK